MAGLSGRLAGHGLIYALAGMAGSLASIALTPLYARCLGPAAYGQLETLLALGQVVTILAAFGAGSAALALIIQPRGEAPAVAGSAVVAAGGTGALTLAAGMLAAPWIAPALGVPAFWIHLVALAGCFTALAQIPAAIWRARGQAWRLAGFSLVQVLGILGLNVVQIAWWGRGADGILISQIAVQATAAVVGLWLHRGELARGWQRQTAWRVVAIGVTHVCNSLATWVVQLSDRFLLLAVVAGAEVGCYTLANKLSFVGQLALASPLNLAWPGILAQIGRDPAAANQYGRIVEGVVAYAGGLFLFVALPAGEWIRLLGGPGYEGAAPMVPVLAAAVLIGAVQPVLLSGFNLAMRFRLIPLITLAGAGLNVALNLWWIPRWGAQGAAWATLCAYGVAAVLARRASQNLWPLAVAWPRIACQLGWTGLLFAIGQASGRIGVWAIVILIYPVGALWLGGWWPMRRPAGRPSAT